MGNGVSMKRSGQEFNWSDISLRVYVYGYDSYRGITSEYGDHGKRCVGLSSSLATPLLRCKY